MYVGLKTSAVIIPFNQAVHHPLLKSAEGNGEAISVVN
jgi:hypothetical protein